MKKIAAILCLLLCIGVFQGQACAQDYPTKPITLILCVPPGGAADLLGRALGSVVEKLSGQPMVVVNKPGASGQTGLLSLLQAAPDGYTLALVTHAYLFPGEYEIANGRKPLVTEKDFSYIGGFSRSTFTISVRYDSPWKTLDDLIKDARANPGKYAHGSGGFNSTNHLLTEQFKAATKTSFRHVPQTGGGPIITALLGNHIDWSVTSGPSSIPLARANKLRFLASLTDKRWKYLPDLPTAKELGVDADFLSLWLGLWAHRNVPQPIITKLEEVLKKVVVDKSFVSTCENAGDEPYFMNRKEMNENIRRDLETVRIIFKQQVAEGKK